MPTDTFPVTVGATPTDIGLALSGLLLAEEPSGAGRGMVRMCNASGNTRLYILIQDTAPDGNLPGLPVRPGDWFPEDIQITPAGGVWAWAGRDGATMTALVVSWS